MSEFDDAVLDETDTRETVVPWRIGRSVGRTIYARLAGSNPDGDVLIGLMDSPEIAVNVVVSHNERLIPMHPSIVLVPRAFVEAVAQSGSFDHKALRSLRLEAEELLDASQ